MKRPEITGQKLKYTYLEVLVNMALLQEKDRAYLQEKFSTFQQPVKIVMFTQEVECQYCQETREISQELAGLSDKISLEVYDFVKDKEVAEHYHIDKIPAIVLLKEGDQPKDYGIRYYGIPGGYEFSSLVEDIIMIATGESGLSEATKKELARLATPLHLQVFVTPTCPYCPQAVVLAHKLAFESELIQADMVEAIEFPHLSMKYEVRGVPRTVINETVHIEGAAPEQMLMAKVQEALA
jgi:glutaredoxin-like protein